MNRPPPPLHVYAAHPYNLSSRAKPRDLRLLPCASPRNPHTTLALSPIRRSLPAMLESSTHANRHSRARESARWPQQQTIQRQTVRSANSPTAAAPPTSIYARSSLQLVIPSEAEGSKTVALRQPSKPPHNPRPDPRHTERRPVSRGARLDPVAAKRLPDAQHHTSTPLEGVNPGANAHSPSPQQHRRQLNEIPHDDLRLVLRDLRR